MLNSRLERYVRFDEVNRPYLRWQLEQFRPYLGRRILEIGCGVGGIIELLDQRELVYGIDIDQEILAYAARRFVDRPECRFVAADMGNLSPQVLAELKAQRFDTVIAINVLEHVRDDIGALQDWERVLEPGGTLALLVPAHLWLYGSYDRVDGHYRRYSKSYLRTILGHTRFRVLAMHYFNAAGALGWWLQYRVLRRSIHGAAHLGAINRILPVMRAIEAWVRPPCGLSLVAVCQRVPTKP